jgi:methylaspartate mutase sigma subunit
MPLNERETMSSRASLHVPRQAAHGPGDQDGAAVTVILGVAASDAHVVANQLIAFQLRYLGYHVVNLGACTPVSQFVACATEHPDALAIVIGSVNGHAVEDLTPLRTAKAAGLVPCPVIAGGNLSVGSSKTGREAAALHRLGVDHVLTEISELIALLGELRAARFTSRSGRICGPLLFPDLSAAF